MAAAVSGFIKQTGSMIKEIKNTFIIHQPSHNLIQLQRASTDTCLLANKSVHMHLSAGYYLVPGGSEQDNDTCMWTEIWTEIWTGMVNGTMEWNNRMDNETSKMHVAPGPG